MLLRTRILTLFLIIPVYAEDSSIKFGGAIRLNHAYRSYDAAHEKTLGDFGFELFRVDVNGHYQKELHFSVQHRFYADFETIHHAYFYVYPGEGNTVRLGITQVPFGILPYASHSFWFAATYYLGFEDDYDMGFHLSREKVSWRTDLAFFKNSEYVNHSTSDRYSFDLVTGGDQQNQESNQINLRLEHRGQAGENINLNAGLSLMMGQIYNRETELNGSRTAWAVHMDAFPGAWNIQLQVLQYGFEPENQQGVESSTVQLGAFQYPFLIAAEGRAYNLNVSRDIDLYGNFLEGLRLYNDFSVVESETDGSRSLQNVTGILLIKGGFYTHVDWIVGENMWFAGGPGIALPEADGEGLKSRLNINVAYYF